MTETGQDPQDAQDAAARRNANEEAFRRAMAAVSRGDVEAQMVEYTEDAVMEFPFADPPTTVEGKAAMTDYLRWAFQILEMDIAITAVHPGADPDHVVAEFTSQGRVLTSGKPYANSYVAVIQFRDGRIHRHREYFNPAQAMEALNPD